MQSVLDIDLAELMKNRSFHPSPQSWESQVLYFLMADRFSAGNEKNAYDPARHYENAVKTTSDADAWERAGESWCGGTLNGIASKLDYLENLGITALWISPVFKQAAWEQSYHGYGIQNFLEIDPHFGSREDLRELVRQAHARGMYVILDIVINHTANVYQYEAEAPVYTGERYPVKGFMDGDGNPRLAADGSMPDAAWPEGGIWPRELMRPESFTRKGAIRNWDAYPEYTEGDFFSLKNVCTGSGTDDSFNPSDALKTITACYKYWMAYADIDGFRLDTVKHLEPGATIFFTKQIHEFAERLGKHNFYIIGEITGGMDFAADMVKKTGLDAALGINKIPEKLENAAKGYGDPREFFNCFRNSDLLGDDEHKWYRDNVITMFDDHDMVVQPGKKSRFCADRTTAPLLLNAIVLNLMSPGIPCLYYGTEQGFDGSGDSDKYIRETMFGGAFGAFRSRGVHFFDRDGTVCRETAALIRIRRENPCLRQGRTYPREVADDAKTFGYPWKPGTGRFTGLIAWSRILSGDEVVIIISCDLENDRTAAVAVDSSLHGPGVTFLPLYRYPADTGSAPVTVMETSGMKHVTVTVPKSGCLILRRV